jgi:hypothetical protein
MLAGLQVARALAEDKPAPVNVAKMPEGVMQALIAAPRRAARRS